MSLFDRERIRELEKQLAAAINYANGLERGTPWRKQCLEQEEELRELRETTRVATDAKWEAIKFRNEALEAQKLAEAERDELRAKLERAERVVETVRHHIVLNDLAFMWKLAEKLDAYDAAAEPTPESSPDTPGKAPRT